MAKIPFRERLEQGVLLLDGAMGTMLHAHENLPIDTCFDLLNLTDPGAVARIHQLYLQAGAEVLETNTFSANVLKLAACDLQDRCAEINRAGVELARRVVDAAFRDNVYVAGSVGPLGRRLAPFGRVTPEEALDAFLVQTRALIEAGADLLLFETFTDLHEIALGIQAARSVRGDMPIAAQMTFNRDDRTALGDTPAQVARALADLHVDIIGVNCSGGPAQLLRILQIMHRAAPEARLSVVPNAGWPEMVGGRVMYPATPDYFGDYALAFKEAGACLIGGCCGTTPEHIRAMRAALDDPARHAPTLLAVRDLAEQPPDEAPEQPTEMARKLAAGEFVVTVEMPPPRSFTAQKVIASAELLREAGVDMINVSDSPMARMRMSPWAVCHLIQHHTGVETVLHFPTRGRNLLRVQGDLLAAHALHVRNVFVVMGDPTVIGDYPDAFDTHDIAPSALIQLIKRNLNAGIDQAGGSIGVPTSFLAGCALNVNTRELDREARLLHKKIEAGADFALTQPVFDPAVVERFQDAYAAQFGPLTLPILIGILPLFGARHAAFLHNEVPGIEIPQAIRARIAEAGDEAPHEGVRIAQELLLALQPVVQGVYLMPAFGRYDLAAAVVDCLGRSHAFGEPQSTGARS
ncbi:MAG: bifunctional homocysteine S-methyltransferase/methylenetetrahydrofolate reductase [Anaerolineae bacterium]|nr:bifunctional homocysteine S-methyltransferase/methylenetetrahydrofolate reductase [Anaerolineae bacterium]